MPAYCTTDDLLAVTSQLTLSSTTKPSLAQAGDILDDVARELDMTLVAMGWVLPIGDANLLGFLKVCNVYGGAGGVFRSRLDFTGAEAWEKKYLGVKRLLPKPGTTVAGDTTPFGDGFPEPDPDDPDDPDAPFITREDEF